MPIIFRVSGHLLKYQMIIKDEEKITLNINEYDKIEIYRGERQGLQ